jgi:hypothetical protein
MQPSFSTKTFVQNTNRANISGVTSETVPEAHSVVKTVPFFVQRFDNKFDDEMSSGARDAQTVSRGERFKSQSTRMSLHLKLMLNKCYTYYKSNFKFV